MREDFFDRLQDSMEAQFRQLNDNLSINIANFRAEADRQIETQLSGSLVTNQRSDDTRDMKQETKGCGQARRDELGEELALARPRSGQESLVQKIQEGLSLRDCQKNYVGADSRCR